MNFLRNCIILLSAVAVLSPFSAMAREPDTFTLETLRGKKYLAARVLGFETDGVRLMHRDGVARVAYADLSETERRKLGPVLETSPKVGEPEAAAAAHTLEIKPAVTSSASGDRDAAAFQAFRESILVYIKSADFDFAAQNALLLKWIGIYDSHGRQEWADVLRADRELLLEREAMRKQQAQSSSSLRALELDNARLQEQIDSLRSAANSNRSMLQIGSLDRTTTIRRTSYPYYSYPYYSGYSYYPYYYRSSVYYPRTSVYVQPRYCEPVYPSVRTGPTVRSVPNMTGGTPNANMQSRGAGN